MVAGLLDDGMAKIVAIPLLFAYLPLLAQETEERKFVGTWEAKWKDEVICTIRLKPGDPISGETVACSIHVDENGDLQAPESNEHSEKPAPILNVKLQGATLTFEENDGDEVTKFELKLVGERTAELSFLDAPVRIKPIQFARKQRVVDEKQAIGHNRPEAPQGPRLRFGRDTAKCRKPLYESTFCPSG